MTTPKIPIYPRPVSPLIAEPLLSAPGDIHLDDSSNSHSDNEERARKRRRIEKLGEQYLRGDGLLIITAALRGPISGWENPWLKKDRQALATRAGVGTTRQDIREEIPDTVQRLSGQSKSAASIKPGHRVVSKRPTLQSEIRKAVLEDQDWLKTVEDHNQLAFSARDDSPTPIRQNCKVRNLDHPTFKKLPHVRNGPPAASSSIRHAAPVSKQPAQDDKIGPTPIMSSETNETCGCDIHPSTKPQSSQLNAATALSTTSAVPELSDPEFVEQPELRSTEAAGGTRSLNFDRKATRRSLHKVPPSTHLPEFEYRLVADLVDASEDLQAEQNDSSRSSDATKKPRLLHFSSSAEMPIVEGLAPSKGRKELQKPAEGTIGHFNGSTLRPASELPNSEKVVENAPFRPNNMPPPSLSTQTSTTTNTNGIPSAQFVPAVQPPSAEPYSSVAGKMIEPEITPTDRKVGLQHSSSAECTFPVTNRRQEPRAVMLAKTSTLNGNGANPDYTDNLPRPCTHEGIVPFNAFESPPTHSSVRELDTQAMLAEITPLGFSTVKKVPLKSKNKVTPATATRTNAQKRNKRASFAPPLTTNAVSSDSSQTSIRGSLKVSKMVDTRTKTGESLNRPSEPSLFGKLGLNMDTSDEDGVAAEAESLLELSSLLRGEHPRQDAPISSGALPRALTLGSTSSAQEQDAQQENVGRLGDGPGAEEGQEDFNLASAMDDLGSFLGTWDADKEAREIGSVTSGSRVKSALKS